MASRRPARARRGTRDTSRGTVGPRGWGSIRTYLTMAAGEPISPTRTARTERSSRGVFQGRAGSRRRVKLRLRDRLFGLARARPQQPGGGARSVLEELHLDVVALAGDERDRAAVLGRRMKRPVVDDPLTVDEE